MTQQLMLRQAIELSILMVVVFAVVSGACFRIAWNRRKARGANQILARRVALVGGFLALAVPLAFLADLWVNVKLSPIYVHNLDIARPLTTALSYTTAALFLAGVLCALAMIACVWRDDTERIGVHVETRERYTGSGPDHGPGNGGN